MNTKRIEALEKLHPELLQNNLIEWVLVEQTYGNNPEQAKELFHGFRITYRATSTKETVEEEIQYIEDALSGKLKPTVETMSELAEEEIIIEAVETE